MSDVSTFSADALSQPEQNTKPKRANPVAAKKSPMRPATMADINLIHARLMEAIETSPYYLDEFKEFEKQRMGKRYLRTLIAADPYHVMILLAGDEPAGFMITSPQYGTLWLHWSYIFPEMRRVSLALMGLRALIAHYDNGRFHKIATYTKHGNPAVALLKRFKFDLTCELKTHIFGEDYLLYELPLNKTEEGYDTGTGLGRLGRLKARLKAFLPF